MAETNTQMRRSISMPVKPLHLEQKTLKRSTEKETVYATDDSEVDDNSDANYLRQRSSPAMVTDKSLYDNAYEPTSLRGLPKHIRSVRDFLANSVNPIFSIFRKSNTNTNTNPNRNSNSNTNASANINSETCSLRTHESNGQTSEKYFHLLPEYPNGQLSSSSEVKSTEQNLKNFEDFEASKESQQERVVFSL